MLILVAVALTLGVIFWWISPHVFKKQTSTKEQKVLGEITITKPDLPKNPTQDLLDNTTNSLEEFSENLADSLYESSHDLVDKVFNKSAAEEVNVSVLTSPTNHGNLTVFDFNRDNNLQIKLLKNTKYQFKFQNNPPNFCLYIDGQKFQLEEGKIIEILFNKGGNYSIKANACDLQDKTIGTITVE